MTMNDEGLIEEIRKFICLWDMSAKAYRDTKAKENAWKVVAKEVASYLTRHLEYFFVIIHFAT